MSFFTFLFETFLLGVEFLLNSYFLLAANNLLDCLLVWILFVCLFRESSFITIFIPFAIFLYLLLEFSLLSLISVVYCYVP